MDHGDGEAPERLQREVPPDERVDQLDRNPCDAGGLCVECDDARSERARREGWIALPLQDALSRLASGV
jgi:hypothetical protein